MAIEPGKLRNRLGIYRKNKNGRDGSGQKTEVLELYANCWAEVLTSKQVIQRLGSGIDHNKKKVFHCRYRVCINVGDVIQHKAQMYSVVAVENPADKNIELYIEAELLP